MTFQKVEGAQWHSGRVLDETEEPHRRHCVVVLEQDTFFLPYYWFNPGRPVPVYCLLDIKNQIKQTNKELILKTIG